MILASSSSSSFCRRRIYYEKIIKLQPEEAPRKRDSVEAKKKALNKRIISRLDSCPRNIRFRVEAAADAEERKVFFLSFFVRIQIHTEYQINIIHRGLRVGRRRKKNRGVGRKESKEKRFFSSNFRCVFFWG